MKTDVKITIKDEERKSLSDSDELYDENLYNTIKASTAEMLKKLLDEFKGTKEDIIIRTTTILK
jgi:hypothetical protein